MSHNSNLQSLKDSDIICFQSMSFSSYNFTQVLTFQFVLYNDIICIYRGYNILQVSVCAIENDCYNSRKNVFIRPKKNNH